MKNFVSIALLACFACACVGSSAKIISLNPEAATPNLIAILPADNESNDLSASATFGKAAAEMILGLGGVPIASPGQENKLHDMGIGDGGQLGAYDPNQIASALGVDGLLYARIHNFREMNIGFYSKKIVSATMRLVDKNGNLVWKISGESYTRGFSFTPAGAAQSLAEDAVFGQLEKTINIRLLAQARQMTMSMLRKLPQWSADGQKSEEGN